MRRRAQTALGPANDEPADRKVREAMAIEQRAHLWLDSAPFRDNDCTCDGCQTRVLANAILSTL